VKPSITVYNLLWLSMHISTARSYINWLKCCINRW